MADSVVSLLLETLNQLLDQDADLLLDVEDEIRSFHVELGLANGFIRNSEGQGNAEAVKELEKEISKAAYDAEGDIDTLAVNVAKQRMRGKFGKFFHRFGHRSRLNDVSTKIKIITKRVKDIYGKKVSNNNQPGTGSSQSFLTGDRNIKEVDLTCFPEALKTLLDQLRKDDGAREIISVVGEVGIGKTALAKKIYNDISVQGHFECLVWVQVSRDCKAVELLNKILERFQRPVSAGEMHDMKEEDLQKKLSDYLQNKRYLIVMDDLRKIDGWDKVEQAFPDGGKGSRILLTCRPEYNKDPQGRPTNYSLPLSVLNEKESWISLCDGIFPAGICAPKFEVPGEQMAQKCKGSPLSLAFLGHLLVMQRQNVEAWYKLANYLNTSSTEGSEHSIDLLLSFVHENLPNHLSLCFLYFGMFPEGAEIPVRQLIQFWIAEGFIRQKGSTKMEDVGEQYLEELIRLNLIQVTARRTDGGVKTCGIHDLFRKFCISKGRETKYLEMPENLSDAQEKTIRRLAIHVTSPKGVFSKLSRCSGVRSFHYSVIGTDHVTLPTARWSTLYEGFNLIRVLNLGMIVVSGLPKEVGRLIHLRYLRIRAPDMKNVPPSICNLLNLQTLDMRESSLSNLPDGIWKLQQLRHLYLFRLRNFCDQGNDEKSLGNLQTLYCIRPHKGMKRLMVKAKFPNVRKLKLDSQNREETAKFLESLDHLYHLQSLKIVSDSKLPDSNAFPLTLTKLTLQDTTLGEDCVKTLEKLPNLRVLKLLQNSVNGEEINFSAGGFPQLQILQMVELHITTWALGRKAMVNLRHLVISKCDHLEKVPDDLKSLANLQIVEALWLSTNLRETLQNILGKDGPKIMIVPDMSVAST
ncbi:disease resistance protein RPP8-like [Alnus glutinosa]|uniref:disease resistance protein RPP8-like n=1 Tax=Alnus glutinosa TaxID=3517 RepID=UPI002D774240|nr:disease resistance protein RPP8-like [Alnus glutinosa]